MSTIDSETTQVDWEELFSGSLASVEIIELSENIQIPSLPTALTKFLEVSGRADCDIRELGDIIEHDPGMTVDLLKCVNSAAVGSSQPVRTARDALVRIGISKARNYLIAAGMKSATMVHESKLMNHHNFWNESLRRALAAQEMARHIGVDAELAFIGGLLEDFALPVLTNAFDTDYMQFMREEAPKGVCITQWEQKRFGWTHAQAGAFVAQKWNLPYDLLCAILFHHEMEMIVKNPDSELFNLFPVSVSALLPDQLSQVPDGVEQLLVADARSKIFRLDELCTNVDAALAKVAVGVENTLGLSPIIQQAREAAITTHS